MGCVNTSSSEFKALAAKHNLSSTNLELIVHKYWKESGNETLFPTDLYIQQQLGNGVYQEEFANVRKLWNLKYKFPKRFSSLEAMQQAYSKAKRFFPQSAITYYKNADGAYTLKVKKPVASVNRSKKKFLEEYDSMKNDAILNLPVKENNPYSMGIIEKMYHSLNTDKTSKELANKVFALAKTLGIEIRFSSTDTLGNKFSNSIKGQYSNHNGIVLNKVFFESGASNADKANVILHEAIHAVSMYALSDNIPSEVLTKPMQKFRKEANTLFNELKDNELLKGQRGIVNVKEFIAELSNPAFRERIQEIDKSVKDKRKKTLWQKIVDLFKHLFNLHVTDRYYQRSMNAVDNALSAFDVDSYMVYNRMKNPLREAYHKYGWDIDSMTNKRLKSEVINAFDKKLKSADYNTGEFSPLHDETANYEDSDYTADIKPQYKGKLIYAQSGTGKSIIADNKTVFDSDYILGDILGVSPETAGFFFGTLSSKQKQAFGKQYRQAIKDKVAQGYTVLTANSSLLNDADVVVYNSSAEQTDERVNREDRALNNRYHAISYHQDTLSKIQDLKRNDKNKEYIELDNKHYLGDYLLPNMGTLSSVSDNQNQTKPLSRARGRGHRVNELERNQLISDFLNEFGFTVNLLNDYDGELPLFDALNRAINAKNASEITEGVGYAIAFMMQGDPEMQRLVVSSHGYKGDYNRILNIPLVGKRSIKQLHPTENSPVAREVINEVGRQIAEELRNNFGTPIEKVESGNKVWSIIKNFFKKIGMSVAARGKRRKVKINEKLLVKDIIEALGREDFSRIKGPRIKEGSLEKANRVDVETALKENPFEDNIIRKLGEHGIALAGSTSIALEGSLYRPSENPLHDIDFSAGDNSSKESLSKLLPTLFPKDTIHYASEILEDGEGCVTFIHLDTPFEVRNRDKWGYYAEYYSKDGKYLGKKEKSDLYLEDGVKGKLLDFFVGKKQESTFGFYKKNINGHNYLLCHSEAAMNAKVTWRRPKDMWDYKNFKKNDFTETTKEFLDSLSEDEVKKELSLMRQEENDYNIAFSIAPAPKQTERTGPQSFTFEDGTTIMAPFKPNEQQVAALNAIDNFINSKDENVMTLSGYAGTGKTSIMEMIADKARNDGKDILFCATTNKATSVLDSKVSKQGFSTMTMDSAFGIKVKVNDKQKSYNMRDMVNYLGEAKVHYGQIVIQQFPLHKRVQELLKSSLLMGSSDSSLDM